MPRKSKKTDAPPPQKLYIIVQKENPQIVWAATAEPPDALMIDESCFTYVLDSPFTPTKE